MAAYSGKLNENPQKFSNDIEIRSGTSSTAEAVADEYVDLGYEPGVGTMYLSTAGITFVHSRSGDDAVTWQLITDVLQTELESFSATLSLAAAITRDITFNQGASLSLTPTIDNVHTPA